MRYETQPAVSAAARSGEKKKKKTSQERLIKKQVPKGRSGNIERLPCNGDKSSSHKGTFIFKAATAHLPCPRRRSLLIWESSSNKWLISISGAVVRRDGGPWGSLMSNRSARAGRDSVDS